MRIFTDAPVILQDNRQSMFKKAVGDLIEKEEPDDVKVTNVCRGFYAASVNLGWLQQKIKMYRDEHRPNITTLKELIEQEFPGVVQRLKELVIKEKRVDLTEYGLGEAIDLNIEFTTKDDFGYYDYKFHVRLKRREL